MRRKKSSRRRAFGAIGAILWFVLVIGCGEKENQTETGKAAQPSRTAAVKRETREVQVAGTIRATNVAQLASRFGGFVSQAPARPGASVVKGELLVQLDDRNLQAQKSKVRAGTEGVAGAIAEAQYQLNAASAQKELASRTYERIRELYEKKSASRQEFDEAESRFKSAEAAWQAAQERVAQAQSRQQEVSSDAQEVQANSEYLRITAPFRGVVTSAPVDVGSYVNPGQTIVSMESLDSYQVIFFVEEGLLASLKKGSKIMVSVPSLSTSSFAAEVVEVSSAADLATRTFQVKAQLPQNDGFRSGLSAIVLVGAPAGDSLWIPANFLDQSSDVETVLVKQENEWKRILVKSGTSRNGSVEILSGLNEGDVVGLQENTP